MPAARLTDKQKSEVVERFRCGEAAQALAAEFGCSPNTVSRAVKAALEPGEYERIKEQRGRRSSAAAPQISSAALPLAAEADPPAAEAPPTAPEQAAAAVPGPDSFRDPLEEQEEEEDSPASLAIDDADDFGEEDDDLLGEDDSDDPSVFVAVPLLEIDDPAFEVRPRPLEAADLPGSAYMLVDKTVELQARPLSEFTELGRLPLEEQERRALMVFVNPRQAKRLCGRTQRVIKIPDPAVLRRTAPFLLAQGISRVVIEGALFSLPGS